MKYLIVACIVISSLNLSHRPAGANHGPTKHHTIRSYDSGRWIDSPPSGYQYVAYNLEREDFQTPKRPVPYAEIWDNPLNQTAQQYVAILSMFEGKPLPEEIFRWVRMKQEERFTETIRQGILAGRYSPKRLEEKDEWQFFDIAGLLLIGLGSVLIATGYTLNRRLKSQLRRMLLGRESS